MLIIRGCRLVFAIDLREGLPQRINIALVAPCRWRRRDNRSLSYWNTSIDLGNVAEWVRSFAVFAAQDDNVFLFAPQRLKQ